MIEMFKHICIEGDAKVYVDAFAAPIDDCLWKIRALISMSLKLALKFSSCKFHWVKRNANQVAHVLTKVAFSLTHPFVCSASSLLASVVEAWNRDLLSFS